MTIVDTSIVGHAHVRGNYALAEAGRAMAPLAVPVCMCRGCGEDQTQPFAPEEMRSNLSEYQTTKAGDVLCNNASKWEQTRRCRYKRTYKQWGGPALRRARITAASRAYSDAVGLK